jgi:hypothetical protein
MFAWWIYASEHIIVFANLLVTGFQIDLWGTSAFSSNYLQNVPYSEYILHISGFIIFYILGVIGLLYMLSSAKQNKYNFALLLGACTLAAIAFIGQVFSFTGFIPHRWFSLSQAMMAIFAALGLILISNLFSTKYIARPLLVIVTTIVCFLMITSGGWANYDSPIYAKDLTARFALTESEQQSMDTISEIYEGKIAVTSPDNYYLAYNREMYDNIELGTYLYSEDFSNFENTMLIIRTEILENAFPNPQGILKLDYDARETLSRSDFSFVYSSQSVIAFIG